MDYVLLTPEETGVLLGLDRDQILGLIESGELPGLRIGGRWRIPLKSITSLLAAGSPPEPAQALQRLVADPAAWDQVFGARPEVTQQIAAGQFPTGSVGAYLKQVIGLDARGGATPAQDPEYGREDPDGAEAATG